MAAIGKLNPLFGQPAGANAGRGTGLAADPAPSRAISGGQATAPSAPPKVSASTSKTLITGLADALKRAQQEAKDKGAIEYPDHYYFEIDSLLQQAKVVPPGSTDKRQTPMGATGTAQDKLDQKTQAVDPNAKSFKILAGTSILQFLDQVVRNTDYIYEQQTKYYDPKTKELVENGNPADVMGWYRIGMQAVPRLDEYDRKRNDYAYDITYRVEVYAINDARSDFFPSAQYRGTHKRYDYWFTGINTQILDYQQDFNYLYFLTQNARTQPRVRTITGNYREVQRYYFAPRSPESDQMNEGPVSEPSAQMADYLYSPRDTAQVKLKILGDPAWIQQGDVRGGLTRGSQLYDAFLPDGTINYAGQEVLFEILWNKPADYDLRTGSIDRAAGRASDATQTNVYRANKCISTFSQGQFMQELEGSQIFYRIASAQARPAPQPATTTRLTVTDTGDETRRLIARTGETRPEQPRSSIARGVQQTLQPPTVTNLTDSQLAASPAYIAARRSGSTAAQALEIARAASAAGTNNTTGSALPGIRSPVIPLIVKDP